VDSAAEFVGVSEAADRLGVRIGTIRRLFRCGELESYVSRLDRRRTLVRVRDLESLRLPQPAAIRPQRPVITREMAVSAATK